MPKSKEILVGLQLIVNDYSLFAIIWHAVFYILIAALISKWVPTNRLLGALLCIPLFSVAVFAWITGNPFNGIVFSVSAVLILVFGMKASPEPVDLSRLPYLVIGIAMVVFGLIYPHFIEANSPLKYLYASPAGLIPCPTLSILIGVLLIFNGFDSQPLMITFIVVGLFYGLFGVLKLAVYLDAFLLAGTIALLTKYIMVLRT